MVINSEVKLEVSNHNNNLFNSSDTTNSNIGVFVKGNRNNFITKTLCKMAREKRDTGSWMEEFSYPYIETDFTKEEIDGIIIWIRKTYKDKGGKKKIISNGKTKKYETAYGMYRQYRQDGKIHLFAWSSVSQTMSMATQKRYRARYNKEFGIKEKRGGKKGRTWKCKKRENKIIVLTKPQEGKHYKEVG